jgi:hypothetical protein
MKQIQALMAAAVMVMGLRAACQDTLTPADGGKTVVDVVTTSFYGTTTIKWLADANFAASLRPDSPYWVPGINRDGSMSLSTAKAFIDRLNAHSYLGISNWRLPTTVYTDTSCSFPSSGGTFGYDCGEALLLADPGYPNPGYPYSELGGLFYNGLGGQAHNNILLAHSSAFYLFKNLQPYLYWSETAQYNNVHFGNDFWFQNGFQGTEDEYDSMFVLPVSTVTTGTAPTEKLPCAIDPTVDPVKCAGLLPGLGLNTTISHTRPTLRPSWDGKLVYDPVLNVVFLANANLAGTLPPSSPYYVKNINPDGSMNQETLAKFLLALNNKDNPYMGLTGWTLPEISVDGSNPDCTINPMNGNPVYGYNCDGPSSQLGELFYNQLGGEAGQDIRWRSNWYVWLFDHLQSDYYWQCQPPSEAGQCLPGPGSTIPSMSFRTGYQGLQSDPNDLFVLLVLPVDAIPHDKQWWLKPEPFHWFW